MIDLSDFSRLTADQGRELISSRTPKWLKTVRDYLAGDHWQSGLEWIGPYVDPADPDSPRVMAEIARVFVSKNAILELLTRLVGAVSGKESAWHYTPSRAIPEGKKPTKAELADLSVIHAAMTAWWNRSQAHPAVQSALKSALTGTRAVLRLYVPRGLLRDARDENGELRAESIEKALELIYIDHPLIEQATVVTDEDRKKACGIFAAETEPGKRVVEFVFERDGKTIVRIVGEDDQEYPLDLGGRLTMFEMEHPRYITPQIIQLQRSLNLSLTIGPKAEGSAGFREYLLLNAQMPGQFVKDERTGKETFVPSPMRVGPGARNFIEGILEEEVVEEEEVEKRPTDVQKRKFTSPSAVVVDPIDANPILLSADTHYRHLLDEGDQSYVLTDSSANVSGKSREQARATAMIRVLFAASLVNNMVAWMLDTALAMAEAFAGTPGLYTSRYHAVAACRPSLGPLSADEQRVVLERYEKGVISREEAMTLTGVDDPDAELARIQASPEFQADRIAKALDVAAKARNADVDTAAVLEVLRDVGLITPEQAAALTRSDTPPVVTL